MHLNKPTLTINFRLVLAHM